VVAAYDPAFGQWPEWDGGGLQAIEVCLSGHLYFFLPASDRFFRQLPS
jgi:hypothetical protein